MTTQEMRNYVSQQYDGHPKWQARVAEMGDDQVIAIYFRMIEHPPDLAIPPIEWLGIERKSDDQDTLF